MNYSNFYLLLVALFGTVLSGCVGSSTSSTELPGEEPKLVFRLSNELKPDSYVWEVSNIFKNELEKESPDGSVKAGEIKVVFYDQGMIGGERQLLESCFFDVIEMVQVNSSVLTTLDPAFSILDLPYLFLDEDQHTEVLYGEIGGNMLGRLEKYNLCGLGFYSTGFRNLFYKSSKDHSDIKSPSDLSGLKIRVMESPIMISSVNSIGPTATPIPFSELFQSIKTGVVDGAENCAPIFMSYKYTEAGCNQFTLTEHFANQHMIIANKKWFDGLDEKYRKRIREAVAVAQDEFGKIWNKTVDDAYAAMGSEGVNINHVKDKTPFVEMSGSVIESFRKKYPEESAQFLDKIIEVRSRTEKENEV